MELRVRMNEQSSALETAIANVFTTLNEFAPAVSARFRGILVAALVRPVTESACACSYFPS